MASVFASSPASPATPNVRCAKAAASFLSKATDNKAFCWNSFISILFIILDLGAIVDFLSVFAYNVGMKTIQYTIRSVSPQLDKRLRQLAKLKGTSLNKVVLETLETKTNDADTEGLNHSLDFLAGSIKPDPEFEAALEDFEKIDEEMWR